MNSRSPSELRAGDWIAIGQMFRLFYFDDPKSGTECARKCGVNVGIQMLAAIDYVSDRVLHVRPVEKTPSPLTAADILQFLDEAFEREGKPTLGILLSKSVWQSSTEMQLDDHVVPRGRILSDLDLEMGPMDECEKEKVVASLHEIGLRVEFDEDRLS